uniref:Kazal-like domain-containing protein n=1 Tax=Cuerna arida TaxID=1464854 RepID=A0A1B6GHQ9_9HEMI
MIWNQFRVSSMTYLPVCLFVGLTLVGVRGQSFSQGEPDKSPVPISESPIAAERHTGLYKLIRSSEDAIRWISNKTTSSLNELFHVKNGTSSPSSTDQPPLPQQTEKYPFLRWLKSAVRDPLAEDESEESTTVADSAGSEESFVFAHRTPDNGFAWGPPGQNVSVGATKDNTTLIDKVRYVLNALYFSMRALTDRCKTLIQTGLTKVFAKKDPFLMRQYASQSIEKQLEDMERNNGSQPHDVMFACDDTMKPVCGVDVDGHYTIFQNECKMVQLNYRYGTNFSVHDKDVCMGLFASSPDLFYQTPTTQQPIL